MERDLLSICLLPPVARIGKFFSYAVSSLTFTSLDSNHISYALGEHPDWLSLGTDGSSLYGTPRDTSVPRGRVVGQPLEIIASDGKGTTTMKATVVVSRNPPPSIAIPLADQIADFGDISAPSSVLSYPDTSFKFSFDRNTFGGEPLNHYATSGDGSPLPAWVSFDNGSMTFSGKTPPFKSLVQPPQAFDLRLVASDIVGFAAVSIDFSIIVGSHNLTADQPMVSLRASWGSKLLYDGFEHGIRLDDKPISPSDLSITTKRLPPWLTIDPTTGKLEGTPGPGDHSTSFTVSFHDPFSDTLDVEVTVQVDTSLFETTVEDMEARPDSRIDVDLAKNLRHPDEIEVELTTSPEQDWLRVHGLRISGHVPKSAKGDFQVSIRAKSKKSGLQETEKFGVAVLALDGSTTVPVGPTAPSTPTGTQHNANPTSPPTTTTTTTTTTANGGAESEPNRLSTGEIMLATIIPVIFISVLLMLLVCCVRRRRARQAYMSGGKGGKDMISHPMAISHDPTDSDSTTIDNTAVIGGARAEKLQHYKPTRGAGVVKKPAPRRRSSDTLGPGDESDSGFSAGTEAYDGRRSMTARSVDSAERDRRSWITIEGDDAASIAPGSAGSHMSDTTFSESTHQLLPAVDSLHEPIVHDFRSGLDMTIPTMEPDQPTPLNIYKRSGQPSTRQSVGAHSIQTSSSVALPSTLGRNWGTQRSMSNWETIAESDVGDSASEAAAPPRRPDRALMGDDLRRRQWYDDSPRIGGGGVDDDRGTDDSFSSSENWRVIGPRTGRQSMSGTLAGGEDDDDDGDGSFKVFM
ncbi:hypothetical protein L249_1504 [Ophiocordyceps polyrhachis-furcata BCC 54312]|uniref:Dystroglycan-type cadherin-like domain-containing protein n=1 Tax=Ophiocordyceps polyrhachis-furcata BCC 54312 TaxID=1330021 RepID=A0A367L422_9HYPO|nr:hypothetical protein L249_1504 [Ophiocordyceps polyrhachis-furcata BCC 54312]